MAGNIIRDDDRTTVIEAVGADYASGDFIVDGLLHGVSLNNVANGADAVVQTVGEFTYTKAAGAAWTEGQELYFDAGNDRFTTTMTADGIVRGYAAKAALLAATSGEIQLCPGHYASEASMVAYDNSTSGLAATDVAAALDEIDDTVDDLGTDKMDLVGTPTAGNLIEMDATGQGVDSGIVAANVQVLTVPVAGHSLAGLTAAGALEDTTILTSSIAGAVTMGGIYGDNMRNSTNLAQSLADATETVVDLEDAELVGYVTYAAGTTSLATIPAGGTGVYAIVYGATFAAGAGTYNRLVININGVTRTADEETPDNANPIEVVGNTMLRLAAGDTVGLYAKQDSGGALDVTTAYMAIQRLQ